MSHRPLTRRARVGFLALLASLVLASAMAASAVDAPEVTLSIDPSGPDGSAGWWITPPEVFATTDADGVVYYTWEGETEASVAAVAGVPVSIGVADEGISSVDVYMLDGGNLKSTTVATATKTDSLPPTRPADLAGAPTDPAATALAWTGSTDPVSGVAGYNVYRNLVGAPFSPGDRIGFAGSATYLDTAVDPTAVSVYAVAAVDEAGNEGLLTGTASVEDTTAPVTTSDALAAYDDAAVVTLTGTDVGFGVETTYYSVNGASASIGTEVVVAENGSHTLEFRSVDHAGNEEATKTVLFDIDDVTPPVTTVDVLEGWYSGPVTVTIDAVDPVCGVAATYYRLDGGAATAYAGPIGFPTEGEWTFDYWSTDTCGNTEETHTVTFGVDYTPPTTTSDAVATYMDVATIALEATDAVSGVKETHYHLDDGPSIYDTVAVISEPGTHTISYESEDWAGNEEDLVEVVFFVGDSIPPVTTSDAHPAYVGTATISFSATDVGVGVAATYASIDGGTVTATDDVVVTGLGDHKLDFFSVDAVGNREATRTVEFEIIEATEVDRVAGATRYDTAVRLSRSMFATGSVTHVVLATGEDFPDTLAAAGLAGALECPVLLTTRTGLPTVVEDEIERLGATEIVIVGGTAAVSQDVQDALGVLGYAVGRVAGVDRYATAAAVAAQVVVLEGTDDVDTVFLVRGDHYADALATSPFAYAEVMPILLTRTGSLPAATADVIETLVITDVVIAGGEAAVSADVASAVSALISGGVTRVSGADRYDTAAKVAQHGVGQGWGDCSFVGIATGEDFADALAGGVLTGMNRGVMVLTRPTKLSAPTAAALSSSCTLITRLVIYGGDAAVSDAVRAEIEALLGG